MANESNWTSTPKSFRSFCWSQTVTVTNWTNSGWDVTIREEPEKAYQHIQCNSRLTHTYSLHLEFLIWATKRIEILLVNNLFPPPPQLSFYTVPIYLRPFWVPSLGSLNLGIEKWRLWQEWIEWFLWHFDEIQWLLCNLGTTHRASCS